MEEIVSSIDYSVRQQVTINRVMELPISDSFNMRVNLDYLYGMC